MSFAPFTAPRPVEVTPVVTVDLPGHPLSGGVLARWSTTRELVGRTLPGNIRARSGLSIRGADINVANSDPIRRTPWAKGEDRVPEGGEATLTATAADGTTWPMGTWIVGPQSGSLRSPEVPIGLYESGYRARGPRRSVKNLLPVVPATPVEPAWIIDALARQTGWWTTPPPVPSAVASLPLNGAVWSEVKDRVASPIDGEVPAAWGGVRGLLGPIGDWGVYVVLGLVTYKRVGNVVVPVIELGLTDDKPLYVTACFTGGSTLLRFGLASSDPMIRIDPTAATIEVRSANGRPWVAGTYVPGLDPAHLDRVQIEIRRAGSPTDPDSPYDTSGTYGPIRIRARSSHAAAWSDWVTDSTPVAGQSVSELAVGSTAAAGGSCAGLQVTREADPALWAPVTAHIDPIGDGGRMPAPWLPADMDAWTGMQEVAGAWLAAVWVDVAGDLQVRDRHFLAGADPGSTVDDLDVGRLVEDLPWELDPADRADRLEVTYAPADIITAYWDPNAAHWSGGGRGYTVLPLLWESREPVRIDPGETYTVLADVDALGVDAGVYQQPFGLTQRWWYAEYAQDAHWQLSTWNARPNRDGTGIVPNENALEVTSTQVSAGRVVITITNRSATPLWTVDGTGAPWLRMRVHGMTSQPATVLAERGATADEAENPMRIDLGRYVQRQADAEAIADYLWDRARDPGYRLKGLSVVPDWSRDVGDIVRLVHPRSGLSQKALITKVKLAGRPGEVSQQLDLVLLPVTVGDLDDLWAGATVGDMDDAYAGRTVGDLDDDPLWTGAP